MINKKTHYSLLITHYSLLITHYSLLITQKKMAKDKERRTAHILYVEQGKSAKDIAELIGVSEKTISGEKGWVNKYGWKEERTARVTSKEKRIENIKKIIDNMACARLELDLKLTQTADKKEQDDIRMQIARIDAGVANWNKTLEQMDKDNKVSLSSYIHVMERVFKSLQIFNQDLYLKTLDFQEMHINQISIELG